jgi:hypothetical protein
MKRHLALLALLMAGCAAPQYLHKGVHDGVELAYRWNHPPGKPSELLVRMRNTTEADREVHLTIDLYYQGRTVETLTADTCIKAGRTMNGKLNGIYFVPTRLTTEQIKSGDAVAEMTRTEVVAATCE